MTTTMTTTNTIDSEGKNSGLAQQPANGEPEFQTVYSPRFDIWEGDEEYVLYGDLPGVASDDLEIQYEKRQLCIHGKVRGNGMNATRLFTEYGIGDFQRVFTLDEAISAEGISAEFQDGVLKLHLPKSDEAKPRRIQVQTR